MSVVVSVGPLPGIFFGVALIIVMINVHRGYTRLARDGEQGWEGARTYEYLITYTAQDEREDSTYTAHDKGGGDTYTAQDKGGVGGTTLTHHKTKEGQHLHRTRQKVDNTERQKR